MRKTLLIIIGIILLIGVTLSFSTSDRDKAQTAKQTQVAANETVEQSHTSYTLEFVEKPTPDKIVLNEPVTLSYKIKTNDGKVVYEFAQMHEKFMHLIIVRKDLTQFQHLHPKLDRESGLFTADAEFTVDGPYKVYADYTPMGKDNPMQLPVTSSGDLDVGNVSNFQPHTLTADTKKDKTVPPSYQVSYDFPENILNQEPVVYSLNVTSNKQPVTLEKYLGALGHSVIIKKDTMEYIHTHAGDAEAKGHEGHSMPAKTEPNKATFTTTFPESGTYKIFNQFQHKGKVLTSDYTVNVK